MARIALFIFSILICGLRAHDSTRCDYFDSVDLTNARKLENGSYVFQGILIPAEYTFKHVENQTSIRGCVCEIKPCINLCSPAEDSQGSLSWDVKMKDGNVVNKHLEDLFALQPGSNMQCDWYYDFDPANKSEDMWELLENGSLAVPHAKPSPILPKQMYCFVFHVNNGTLIAKNCIRKIRPYDFPQNYILWVSIFFLGIGIITYFLIPKPRDILNMCFVRYLACLTVGFIFLGVDKWEIASEASQPRRAQIGYFAVMAAFLWLSVISYILWKTLTSKGSHCLLAETGCKKYKLYVWGTATVLLVVSVLADNFVSKSKWKPNFGAYSGWIATDSLSALIYYYGPMSLLIFGNITMFVLTAVDLIKTGITIQIQISVNKEQQKANLKRQTDLMYTFIMTFVAMGVTWLWEIISYFCEDQNPNRLLTVIGDIVNSAQGLAVSLAFILRNYNTLRKRLCFKRPLKGSSGVPTRYETDVNVQFIGETVNPKPTVVLAEESTLFEMSS